jgi:hypothetical protein
MACLFPSCLHKIENDVTTATVVDYEGQGKMDCFKGFILKL